MTPPNLSLVLIMICFWITLWLVHRYLIVPIGRVLEERHRRIDGAQNEWSSKHEEYLSATSRLEREMEDAAREASTVRGTLVREAMDERQGRLDEVRATADERLDAALQRLAADAEDARGELRTKADGLARLLAGRLLEREVQS